MTTEKKMYDMKVASDALSTSMGGLEERMNKLAKSKGLAVISRLSSGVFSNFWAIQNKIRAGFTIIDEMYKKQRETTKEAMEAMESLVALSDMAEAMRPFEGLFDMDFSSLDIETAMGQQFTYISDEYVNMSLMYDNLKENMKGFEAIEFSLFGKDGVDKANLEDMVELLETTQALIQPQRDELVKRQDEAISARETKKEFDKMAKDRGISEDSPFGKFRLKVLRMQFKVNKMTSKIMSKTGSDYIKAIQGGAMFFAKAMLAFTAIVLGLFMLKTAFDSLKPVLTKVFEDMSGFFSFMVDMFVASFGLISLGISELVEGFRNGDFLQVLWGLFNILSGVLGLVVATLVTVIGGVLVFIGSLIVRLTESLLKGGEEALNTLAGILLVIGTVVLYLVLIGSALATWPVILAAAIGVAVAAAIKKIGTGKITGFYNDTVGQYLHTGGVVNSNMQLVGEKGAELVSLPRGSRVHSNADSKRMGGSGGNTIHVHVNGRVGASDAEIRDIANKVAREINLRMSRTGSGVNNF